MPRVALKRLPERPPSDKKAFGTARTFALNPAGADWLARYNLFMEDGETVVAGPHNAWAPRTNNLVFQLRKREVGKVVLAGKLANPWVAEFEPDPHRSRGGSGGTYPPRPALDGLALSSAAPQRCGQGEGSLS